jgi:hypothetical protein
MITIITRKTQALSIAPGVSPPVFIFEATCLMIFAVMNKVSPNGAVSVSRISF